MGVTMHRDLPGAILEGEWALTITFWVASRLHGLAFQLGRQALTARAGRATPNRNQHRDQRLGEDPSEWL